MTEHRNPAPTVDIIIEMAAPSGELGIVLVERRNPPFGWALPGGFVEYGETLEAAAAREAKEETALDLARLRQFRAYSDPARDPRGHTISMVFIAEAEGPPHAGDDAGAVVVIPAEEVRLPLAFDHRRILDDYIAWKKEPRHG